MSKKHRKGKHSQRRGKNTQYIKNSHHSPVKKLPSHQSFFQFLWKDKTNRSLIYLSLVLTIIQFSILLLTQPIPYFFSDSHTYIADAVKNLKTSFRPLGYSTFLTFIHDLSPSSNFLVGIQYFSVVFAALFCFFSVDFLLGFHNKWIKYLLYALIVVNPYVSQLANSISSDSIFAAITITWVTLLLWILKRKSWWALAVQTLFVYWAFSLRFNAIYYPVVVAMILLLTPRAQLVYKSVGIFATFFIIFQKYSNIKKTNESITGVSVFAGFSGWQMANNALNIYKHTGTQTHHFDDPRLKLLDQYVEHYIDSISPAKLKEWEEEGVTMAFLWDNNGPLKQYLYRYMQDYRTPYFSAWFQVSEIYNSYGKQVISSHPGIYLRYFVLHTLKSYFLPGYEYMNKYDIAGDEIIEDTKNWFKLKEDKYYVNYDISPFVIPPYRFLNVIIVCLSLITPLAYAIHKKKKQGKWDKWSVLLVMFWYLLYLSNLFFIVSVSTTILRYIASWFLLGMIFPLWFLDQMLIKKRPEPINSVKEPGIVKK